MQFSVIEIIFLSLSPFLIHTVLSIFSFFWWLYHCFRCGPSIEKRFNLKRETSWAIVTGSTSGVGLGFAERLAEAGFNLLLISRTASKLEAVAKDLKEKNNIKVQILTLDLETFPNANYDENHFLNDVLRLTENERITLLICNAGMSDLARHFTDKPLKRNLNLMNLNTTANITMIQVLLPKLLLDDNNKVKKPRAGIITVGALTAVYPGPVYGISSGNKHFMRGFTLAAQQEFYGKIDFLIAHPVAVQSNILVKKTSYAISARTFARNALKDFCKGRAESYGLFLHEATTMFLVHFMSRWQRGNTFLRNIEQFSEMLERPINLDPIETKLAAETVV